MTSTHTLHRCPGTRDVSLAAMISSQTIPTTFSDDKDLTPCPTIIPKELYDEVLWRSYVEKTSLTSKRLRHLDKSVEHEEERIVRKTADRINERLEIAFKKMRKKPHHGSYSY